MIRQEVAANRRLANVIGKVERDDVDVVTRTSSAPGATTIVYNASGVVGYRHDPDGSHDVHVAKMPEFDRAMRDVLSAMPVDGDS